jgi:hypothetical protein
MKPYLYRTRDFGESWEPIAGDPMEGFAWVIAEDTVNPDLLFAGTEWGLWISIAGARQWARFEGGLPRRVAVHDLVVHPRTGDLVIATHGRGVYVLDDLTPLRALTAETIAADVAFLPVRPAQQRLRPAIGTWFSGDDEFVGANPPQEASIVYWLRKRHLFGDLKLEIYDAEGRKVATLAGSKRVGLNRVGWPMRLPPPKVPPASSLIFGSFEGPRVPEGTYRVRMIKGKETYESEVTLVADPRNPHSAADREAKQATELRVYEDLERLAYVGDSLAALRDAARQRAEKAPGKLAGQLRQLADDAESLRASFVARGDGYIGGDLQLREKLGALYGNVLGYEGRPSPSQMERLAGLEAEVVAVEGRFAELLPKRLPPVSAGLARAGLEVLAVPSREEWKARDAGAGATEPPAPFVLRM